MKISYTIISFTLVFIVGCNSDLLDVRPASQFSDDILQTSSGIEVVLNSAYDNIQYDFNHGSNRLYLEEGMTDVLVNFRGALNQSLQPYHDFTFNSNSAFLYDALWQKCYSAIRDANTLIDAVPRNPELSEAEKAQVMAEARFIRGLAYQFLYGWFGPVPLIDKTFTNATADFNIPRSTEETMVRFITEELTQAAGALPIKQPQFGRATKGAALASLTKFYLQNKNWEAAAATAKQVIELKEYKLWNDYTTLFSLANEGNAEMIFGFPCLNIDGNGNVWVANALPPLYPVEILNTATQVCVPVAFYNSFDKSDKRRSLMIASYTNKQGVFIDLTTGVEFRNPRSLKYPIDEKADQRTGGQDIILYRYADILLARAEALVMSSNAVNEEALNLLNQVRVRAGLQAYSMGDVSGTAVFIDKLLQERAWEFYSEGKRREDLIRHDRFVQNARNRGKNAQPYHFRLPIPQREIDANPKLVQNQGY
jgi:starch-binding outer membrane protein, SusD/RagB family